VSNDSTAIAAVDDFQTRYAPLPDYSRRSSAIGETGEAQADISAGWTSFAGVVGSVVTMGAIWLTAWILRKKQLPKA
ncbi:unnamed protein product, partial [marine sediment metagenome]